MKIYVLNCGYAWSKSTSMLGTYSTEEAAEAAWTTWRAGPEGRGFASDLEHETTSRDLDEAAAL